MKMTEFFLAQLEAEAAVTRPLLERVPEGRPDWKPHEKSMPLGYLAALVARLPSWIGMTIKQDELDLRPQGGSPYTPQLVATSRELVQVLDESVAEARAALRGTTDEHLMTTWRLLVAGHVVSEDPRYVVIRSAVFNHLAHHRGQLTVYLRLNDVPVPAIYGPTADEGRFQ
jgi:uncharacterized damage-inducible protein DinB